MFFGLAEGALKLCKRTPQLRRGSGVNGASSGLIFDL
jgi:hypothetical protein